MNRLASSVVVWIAVWAVAVPSFGQDTAPSSPYPTTATPTSGFSDSILPPPSLPSPLVDSGSANPYANLPVDESAAPYPTTDDAETVPALPFPEIESPGEKTLLDDELEDLDSMEEDPTWYRPSTWIRAPTWSTTVEFGLNGTSGSNESLSFRAAGHVKRKSTYSNSAMDFDYNQTSAAGVQTQNNAKFDYRNDLHWSEKSRWSLFSGGTLFYDEFQAFDLQINANMGVGYRLVNEDWMILILRTGSGTSREINGPDDRWVPEAIFAMDYEQQLTETQKAYGKLEYFPDWEDYGQYRLVTDLGWELEFARPSRMSLKLSVTDRYDSTPNGAEPEILNYSALLMWKL